MLTSKSQVFLLPAAECKTTLTDMCACRIPLVLQGRETENTMWANGCHKEVQPQAATVLLRQYECKLSGYMPQKHKMSLLGMSI